MTCNCNHPGQIYVHVHARQVGSSVPGVLRLKKEVYEELVAKYKQQLKDREPKVKLKMRYANKFLRRGTSHRVSIFYPRYYGG